MSQKGTIMVCPFCKAKADLDNNPLLMFAGGIGLGILMTKHPDKVVDVCPEHLPFAREVGASLGADLNWGPEPS